MSKRHTRPVIALLRLIGLPIRFLAALLHCKFNWRKTHVSRKKTELVIGTVLMVAASSLSAISIAFVPHCIWDAGCWLLHGIGASPVIEAVLTAVETD